VPRSVSGYRGEKVTECSVCFLQVDPYKNLKIHWMIHLVPATDDEEGEQTNKKGESDYDMAEGKPSKVKDKKCLQCSFVTCRSRNLSTHVKCVHNKIKDKPCSQCEYVTGYAGNLSKHIKIMHEKIKDKQCSQCEYKTSYARNLAQHIKAGRA
jgi:hypothetical protein